MGDLGIYGWRARIGVITPMSHRGVVILSEFNQLKPVGTDMVVEHIFLPGAKLDEESLTAMNRDMVNAAKRLKAEGADIILYGCTSGSFIKGPEYEQGLIHDMMDATGGLPSITMTGSVIEALRVLNMKRIVLVSPYPPQTEEALINFLKRNGLDVIAHKADVFYKSSHEIADAPPGFFYRLVKQAFVNGADGIFIGGGNVRTIEVIDILESDFGVPVVTSNLASIWRALRTAGVNQKIPGYGKLLREY